MTSFRAYIRAIWVGAAALLTIGAALISIPDIAVAQQADAPMEEENDRWYVRVTPFYWASNVSGALTLGHEEDRSIGGDWLVPVVKHELDSGWAGALAVGKGRFEFNMSAASTSVFDTGDFVRLSNPADTVEGDWVFDWKEIDGKISYEISPASISPTVRMYAGLRWMHWIQDQDVDGEVSNFDEVWIDPLIGARTSFPLGSGFLASAHADAAGFGLGSQLSWTVSGGFGYHVAGPLSLNAMYVYKQVSYDNGKEGDLRFEWEDGVAQGWFFGGTLQYPWGSQ